MLVTETSLMTAISDVYVDYATTNGPVSEHPEMSPRLAAVYRQGGRSALRDLIKVLDASPYVWSMERQRHWHLVHTRLCVVRATTENLFYVAIMNHEQDEGHPVPIASERMTNSDAVSCTFLSSFTTLGLAKEAALNLANTGEHDWEY